MGMKKAHETISLKEAALRALALLAAVHRLKSPRDAIRVWNSYGEKHHIEMLVTAYFMQEVQLDGVTVDIDGVMLLEGFMGESSTQKYTPMRFRFMLPKKKKQTRKKPTRRLKRSEG